ncbi:nucleotide exchange factor GrpE [Candidatus Saccharibacteria bacterium]|nr:nucleotide exchange factor GrpE [Candidatus Saccharibacteria bacterium]
MKNKKDNVDGSNAEIQKNIEEKLELLNDLQRTRADFENYRKQIEAQKENEKRAARFATVMKFLPLLDDIDRAILTYPELEPLKKTIEKTLGDLGLAKISSDAGVEFNPDLHEAVMTEGDGDTLVIAETLRPGYFYEKEVLRPAMVKVTAK